MTRTEYRELLVATSAAGLFPATEENRCMYRTGDGRRCAGGLLIPDAEYRSHFEGLGVLRTIRDEWLPEGVTVWELQDVQSAHDRLAKRGWSHEEWLTRLREVLP